MQKKGYLESCIAAVLWSLSRICSFVYVGWFRIRGYRIGNHVQFHRTSVLFQSTSGAISIGSGSDIRRNTRISAGFDGRIHIGKNVLVDEGSQIMAQKDIEIGDNTLIAPYCFITDFNHRTNDRNRTVASQGYESSRVTIGENVWIGTHAVILSGITIGRGAVIGAGSVVTHDVAPFTVVAGNPAKCIRHLP